MGTRTAAHCAPGAPGPDPAVLDSRPPARIARVPRRRPDRAAVIAASMLAFDPVDRLTHDQHLALLRFLCDAALDSEKMRSVLQRECRGWLGCCVALLA